MSAVPRIFRNAGARAEIDPSPFSTPTREPLEFHRRWPGYSPTSVVDAPAVADTLGVRRVLVKAETARFGLPSFKILGALWATYRELLDRFELPRIDWADTEQLIAALSGIGQLTLVAATDGNHGRGVARVARLLGYHARILVPHGTAAARIEAIRSEGAEVAVVDGTYDDAVAAAAAQATTDTLVISDTAWPGYERVPQRIIEGYSTIFWEIDDELTARGIEPPSVVVAQMGVGGLAAAAVLHYRTGSGPRPILVGAEPSDADCVLESVAAGQPTLVPGPHHSIMAGLNCGLPSPLALPLLQAGVDVFVAIDDDAAIRGMRALAGSGIAAGESGAAGLAALLAAHDAGGGDAVGLDAAATVLVVCTEGVTDPDAYDHLLAATTG